MAALTRDAVLEIVVSNLAEILEKSPSDIGEDVAFGDLGADSLALIELVEAIEDALSSQVEGFHIDDEDLETLTNVRQAVDYVTAKLQSA
jgi:acyl carrier protein